MVSARVLQNKQALEDLGESTENFELETAQAEQALNSIGVSIRGEGGDLRDLEDILDDVAKKWGTLSDSTKQYVSEKMAGNNRRSYLVGLLENYDRVIELQKIAENSEGAMAEASAKQAESLEGRLNSLNNTLTDLYDRFLTSDMLGTGIDMLQGFLEGTINVADALDGKLLPALAGLGSAMVALKWQSVSNGLISIGLNIASVVEKVWVAVTAFGALKLAMIGIGAGAVVAGISFIIGKIKEHNENLAKAKENVEELKSSLKTLDENTEMINQWESLNQQLEQGQLTTEKRNEIEAEILELKNELISRSEAYASILENETAQYEQQAEAMRNMSQYDKEKKILDTIESTEMSDGERKGKSESLRAEYDDIARLNGLIAEEQRKQQEWQSQLLAGTSTETQRNQLEKWLAESKRIAQEYKNEIVRNESDIQTIVELMDAYNEARQKGIEEGFVDAETVDMFEIDKEILTYMEERMGYVRDVAEVEEEVLTTKKTQAELSQQLAMSEAEIAEKASKTNAEYVATLTSIRDARELLQNINKEGMTLDNMSSLSSMFEGFTGNLNDAGEVTSYLTDQIKSMEESAIQSYQNMMNYDNNYWESKVRNSQEWADYQASVYAGIEQLNADLINSELAMEAEKNGIKLDLMNVDLTNAKNIAEAQNITEGTLINNILGYWGELFSGKANGRNRDLDNLEDFLNAQGNAEITTIKQLVDAWNKYYTDKYNKITTQIDAQAGDYGDLGNVNTEDMAQLHSLRKMAESFKGLMTTIDVSFDRVSANVDKAKVDIGSLTDPSTKNSSSSNSREQTVTDLEDLRDRYYEINNALKDVSNSLTLVETKMKNASGVDKVNLYKQEIQLLQKKAQLLKEQSEQYEDRRWEIHYQLQQAGFQFNGEDISNYQSKFKELQDWANSLAGDEKEKAKERVQNLMEMVNEYTDLVKDKLPSVTNEWEDMTNAIKEAEKEMAEAVTDSQKEVGEALEHYLSKRYNAMKEAIEKEKKLLNDEWSEEDYQDNLATEERKLAEIQQQIDNLMRDTSEAGKLKLEQLKQQYLDQQKVINDMIKDHERDQTNDKLDNAIDQLDKELEELLAPEKLIELINQAITTGFVTIGEQTLELNDIMNTWLNETGDGLYAVGDILRSELVDNLETAKALMADMGITTVTGGNSSKTRTIDTYSGVEQLAGSEAILRATSGGAMLGGNNYGGNIQVVFDVPLVNVEGNVAQDTLPDLERIMKQQEERLIVKFAKMINKK